ncbi:stalk domain-containing protein [Solibacillus sp. R5-41]|uniref:stalk domain-containing protein n=1 Tax=Solibacillus sp. R5-41 TaxID=2048654 RepID=UPI0012FE0BBB|nr:stalk domain-containing protein [Solibacillus sp. R5-41]
MTKMNMNMKRITPLALSVLLLGTVTAGATSPPKPNEVPTSEETKEINQATSFMHMQGTIGAIENRKDQTFFSTTDKNNPFNFTTNEETLVFDKKGNKVQLKKGDKVSIYTHANQPMLSIYPPQYNPAVIIVENEEVASSVKVTTFNEELLSEDQDLKLNIGDETVIVNEKGEKVGKEALAGNDAIVFYTFSTFSIPAQTTPEKIIVFSNNDNDATEESPMTEVAPFMNVKGAISSAEKQADGTIQFSVTDENNPFNFRTDKNTIVLDKKGNKVELKKGDKVSLFVSTNQPMILIFPPQYSPAVVIVEDEKSPTNVVVTDFNEGFINKENDLKLNISNETVIVNEKGEKVAKEALLENHHAIVFYGVTTRSIPAQTTPEKIVVFPNETNETVVEEKKENTSTEEKAAVVVETNEMDAEIAKLINKDFYEVDGKVMVPLRIVAEGLGFKVDTTTTKTGAIVSKGALSYTITRGEKMYGHNRALAQFEVAPALLESGKTYVEYDFALQLLN